MRLFSAYTERVKRGSDGDPTQALIRLTFVALLLIYTWWVVSRNPEASRLLWLTNVFSLVFSAGLLVHILRKPSDSPPRRVLGVIHDNLLVTLWLHQAGTLGALYLFAYPFVTVGNGFRFGVRYLALSGLMGALGIGSLVVLAPEWRGYGPIGLAILLSHLLVTVYTGALLRRMQNIQLQLEHFANYDALTGLPNRRFFIQKVEHLLAAPTGGNLACLYLDLDGFKLVNDACGHEVGDRLLKCVAEGISENVRATDLSARLGGDEFAVVLGMCTADEARATAQRIRSSIEHITLVDGHTIAVSASVGIAYLPANTVAMLPTADALLKMADQAMYTAKRKRTGLFIDNPQGARLRMTG